MGLYFPKIEYQNIANRSSLVKKAIISTSKFTSIKLNDHIYSHKFVIDKESSIELSKFKYNKKKFKSQIIKEVRKKYVKISHIPKSGIEINSNIDLLPNKLKFNAKENGKIEINEENIKAIMNLIILKRINLKIFSH